MVALRLFLLLLSATIAVAITPIDHHDRHEDPDEDIIIEATKEKFESLVEDLDFVAVVFYTKNCKECEDALRELEYIDDDLDKYGIEMIKVNNIEVAAEHGVTTFPTLIFWRREVPILYEGKFDDREVFDWLIHHKNSYVRVLTDDNFERVTQAASGATTGDWYILYYEGSDKLCQKIMPGWESVGARLDHKMNIGKIDTEQNPELDERFDVKKVPKIIFFRQGKMYVYNRNEFDTTNLVSFGGKWYKTVKPDRVPRPTGREDLYYDPLASELSTRNFLLSIAAASIGLVCAATLLIVVFIGLGYLKMNTEMMFIKKRGEERAKEQ